MRTSQPYQPADSTLVWTLLAVWMMQGRPTSCARTPTRTQLAWDVSPCRTDTVKSGLDNLNLRVTMHMPRLPLWMHREVFRSGVINGITCVHLYDNGKPPTYEYTHVHSMHAWYSWVNSLNAFWNDFLHVHVLAAMFMHCTILKVQCIRSGQYARGIHVGRTNPPPAHTLKCMKFRD